MAKGGPGTSLDLWATIPMSVLHNPSSVSTEQAERLLACFEKAVRHELPNQLVAIQGLARLVAEEQANRLDPEGRYQLDRLIALARRTDALVRVLADLARFSLHPEPAIPTSLADVAREAAAEVNLLSTGQPVEYHLQNPLPTVTLAPSSLRQVLVELFRNAVHRAAPDRPLRIEVGAVQTPAGVEFWVADDGPGLSSPGPEQLFDPFAGGVGASSKPGQAEFGAGSFGLGMFLVRQVVATWGGSLRVESVAEAGTRFVFQVPGP
jgi:signal transduction histidine kinase